MISTFLDLTVRVGCRFLYETTMPTPALFILRPRVDDSHLVVAEHFTITPGFVREEFNDSYGNTTRRALLQPGTNTVAHDAMVAVTSQFEPRIDGQPAISISEIPTELLRYTLPSRYCDSDKLLNFAWQQFGHIPNGLERVQAICDWTHNNIEYRFGAGSSVISASEVVLQRFGVCRDFAHVAIAFCRAFNLPARYVTGHLPDIGHTDPGTPMDFHAYLEVFLGQQWHTFDARFNEPRIGRVKVAQGLDAVDGAFSTIYGEAQFVWFEVWAYQVNPAQVTVGDPVDMSKRLDGTPAIRRS
jgi:transglutaminase-like putative cysteine protease